MKQYIYWTGFSAAAQMNPIYDASIKSYGDLYTITSENIDTMSKY